ncbi:MAG: hypothetical protein WD894_21285 [Pirellulales bacterium]
MIRTSRHCRSCLPVPVYSRAAKALAGLVVALACTATTAVLGHEVATAKATHAETRSAVKTASARIESALAHEPGGTRSGPATTCPSCVRVADQVWVISTRRLGCTTAIDATPNFAVQQRLTDGSWAPASISEFIAADDPAIPTCFVMHGNQVDTALAVAQGMRAYQALTASLPADQSLRFVIWSWPSDRIHGILKDVRIKAVRTTTEGQYLAWTLHQLNPQTPVSVVGFSYGARIATGALHVLAGGSLNGFSLPPSQSPRAPMRAVLVAPGLHNHWLAEGHYHGRALEIVDEMLLIKNSCDSALRRYRFVDTSRSAEALGYTGPVGWSSQYGKIRTVDACCDLGKAHDWELHLASPRYAALMRQYTWPLP